VDLIDDNDIFNPLCEHLNSLLCVMDFSKKNDESGSKSFDFQANDPFFLPIDKLEKKRITNSNYKRLLLKIINNIQIPESCIDIFRSEFDDELVHIFMVSLREQTKVVTIEEHELGYKLNCPAMISDLIMPVLSRFHAEVLSTLKYFYSLLEAVGGNTGSLFLNAKSPNPVSQYIQMFVAKELNIPERPFEQRSVVV
jgi:hypothetical protein